MKLLGTLAVFPVLPKPLERLNELAYNLWWAWSPAAQSLFEQMDPDLWDQTNHNPVKLLHTISADRLAELAGNQAFLAEQQATLAGFDAYMNPTSTWFSRCEIHLHRSGSPGKVLLTAQPSRGTQFGIGIPYGDGRFLAGEPLGEGEERTADKVAV